MELHTKNETLHFICVFYFYDLKTADECIYMWSVEWCTYRMEHGADMRNALQHSAQIKFAIVSVRKRKFHKPI